MIVTLTVIKLPLLIQTFGLASNWFVRRITGLMKRINSMGAGIRGERSFEFTNYSDLLKGFEFNRTDTFGRAFYAPYSPISFNANRDIFTWDIPDFNADSYINAPEGSTHFKLILAGGLLSNYAYDSNSESFEAVEKDVNLIKNMVESSEMSTSGDIGSAINLSCDFGIGVALPADVIVVAATGIIFYQEINSQFYELASGNAMRTDAVG